MMEGSGTSNSKQPILAAVDFSDFSESALVWAVKAARKAGAPLVVLHVVHDPGAAPGYYSHTKKRQKHLKRIEDAAGQEMKQFIQRIRRNHPDDLEDMEKRLVTGLPVNRILEVAEQIDAQLIVMGSHGRTGLSHAMLGSKAEKVVQLSPITVVVVKTAQSG